eukprot:CAMPEP_0203957670 /NCGR_PEP_ID=MMETSP0359-20131031/89438_1 /ASSEMBLY_ACC=CAM_ASM_000338 /TAXON_ID=268821 /ORGANISM="Scrippsiella Hangoei, Strain SHTV-5" /LENGTH=50 /DNA_ID=CAMNT_0050891543 /DNA_START=44 /DNA_END=193 /DNA_ORIENTATION=+
MPPKRAAGAKSGASKVTKGHNNKKVGADRIKSKVLKAAPKAKGKDVAAKE